MGGVVIASLHLPFVGGILLPFLRSCPAFACRVESVVSDGGRFFCHRKSSTGEGARCFPFSFCQEEFACLVAAIVGLHEANHVVFCPSRCQIVAGRRKGSLGHAFVGGGIAGSDADVFSNAFVCYGSIFSVASSHPHRSDKDENVYCLGFHSYSKGLPWLIKRGICRKVLLGSP